MTCVAEQRTRVDEAIAELERDPAVFAATRLDPDTDPTGYWTIDVVLSGAHEGLPPHLAETLAGAGFSIRSVDPQVDHWQALAVLPD